MSIQFVDPLDADKIYKHIQDRIQDAELNFSIWKIVQVTIEKFEGKAFSKRIATAVEKAFQGKYNVYYEHLYGMFHLRIWGSDISYNNEKSFLLGYDTDPFVNFEKLLDWNMCYELEKSRAEKLHTITLEALKVQVDQWNSGLSQMQAAYHWSKQFEIQYSSYGFDLNIR